MAELSNILKILKAGAGEAIGTCLNGTACTVLLEHIEKLEAQHAPVLPLELEVALSVWDAAVVAHAKAFDSACIEGRVCDDDARRAEWRARPHVLEAYRNHKQKAQEREHHLNPQGVGNE